MRRPVVWGLILVVAGVAFSDAARAEASGEAYRLGPVEVARGGPDAFLLGLGAFDVRDYEGELAAAANLEYRFGRKFVVVGPALGLVANTGGGIYGYFALYADISIGPVVLTPQLAAGGYREGDSLDLGGVFAFREALDLSYRFEDGGRLGVRIAHISNAGIYERNPGVEEAYVTYSLPLGPVF